MTNAMHCPQCKKEITPQDKFCPSCGTKIADSEKVLTQGKVICPSCGIENHSNETLCESCGSVLNIPVVQKGQASNTHNKEAIKKGQQQSLVTNKLLWGFLMIFAVIVVFEYSQSPNGEVVTGNQPAQVSSQSTPHDAEMLQRVKELDALLEKSPNDADALLELANRLQDLRFYPRAIETYKKYIQVKNKDTDAMVDLAICYFESGDFTSAVSQIEKALKIDPKHQMGMFNLGVMYLNNGDMKKSNEWFSRCVKVNDKSEIGKRAQQLLTQHNQN